MRQHTLFLRNVNGEHMRYISLQELNDLAGSCTANRVWRRGGHGKSDVVIGAQLCMPVNPPVPGAATIKKSEVMANAGLYGKSRTARMTEQQKQQHVRVTRYACGAETTSPEPDDFVEIAQAKVEAWDKPESCSDRAISVQGGKVMRPDPYYLKVEMMRSSQSV